MITFNEIEDCMEKGEAWLEGRKKPQIGRDEGEPRRLRETVERLTERNQQLADKVELLEELIKISSTEGKTTFKDH